MKACDKARKKGRSFLPVRSRERKRHSPATLMSTKDRKRWWGIFALLAAEWALAGASFAQVQANPPPPKSSETTPTVSKRASATKSSPRRRRIRRRGGAAAYRRRLARMRPHPDRVKEIQQALIQAGYLQQKPSGQWDAATRQAMLRFQADHRFPTTGLPEAKSLMKLGLGPHPLPEDVASSFPPQARARPPSPSGSEASSNVPGDP